MGLGLLIGCFALIPHSSAQNSLWSAPEEVQEEASDGETGYGTIDRIDGEEIVVDDSLYRLHSSLTVYSAKGQSISFHELQVGSQVGYQVNREGEMISIWETAK